MIIHLLRHGETTGDIEDRYGGDYDDSLTRKGREQVEQRAQTLVGKNIQIIFASSKKRAQESAVILSRVLKIPVDTVTEWRERNFYGILTGMKKSEAKEKYPDLVPLLAHFKSNLPDSETYDAFRQRILLALKKTIDSAYDAVLVVTHGGPISFVFREVLNLGEFKKLGDCALVTLRTEGKTLKLEAIEDAELKTT